MVHFQLTSKKLLETKAECLVFFVEKDFTFSSALKQVAKDLFPKLQAYMKANKFTGDEKSSLLIPISGTKDLTRLLFIGLGKPTKGKTFDVEVLRRAVGQLIRLAETHIFQTIAMQLPEAALFGVTADYLAKQVATIFYMACYQFDEFITDESRKFNHNFKVSLVVQKEDTSAVKKGLKEGEIVGKAVNKARYWVDLPPADLTPVQLAINAENIAKKHDFKITVFGRKKVVDLGMGGLAAVSSGSSQDCRFVVLEYKTKKKNAPTLAFVGKGITFDSGGLSLKPAAYMETMKEDMSGAAAVIAAMDALGDLKPDVNIVCLTPLSENLPSDNATKPGDIVKFYNGTTAEIKNTDAEGRLVLCDALAYAVKHYKPDAMIDLATLTGACQYAFGPFYCALLSKHEDFTKKVQEASYLSGERVWPLPFNDDYKPAIKSLVADMKNVGDRNYYADTVIAAFFLKSCVGQTPWVHLDIASTAFDVPAISYYRKGATGFGVRLLVELAMNWK